MRFLIAVLPFVVVAGCGDAEPSSAEPSSIEYDVVAQEGSSLNGSSLNGSSLNGSSLNGSSLNGNPLNTSLASVSFAGVRHNGSNAIYDDVWLEGSELRARLGAALFSGDEIAWAEFPGKMADGSDVRLRISSVTPPAAGDDRWRYRVQYHHSGSWWQACKRDGGGAATAYALAGTWSYAFGTPEGGSKSDDGTAFTFACTNGRSALAKCVDLGYRPWAELDLHHQACVRLLRADYCGDGNSHTKDGSRVNLFDGIGVQKDTENWLFEAEWDENGARCFSPLNRSHALAPCYQPRLDLGCGLQQFPMGTLLVNETQSIGLDLGIIDIGLGLGF